MGKQLGKEHRAGRGRVAMWGGFGLFAAVAATAQAGELYLLNYGPASVLGAQGNRDAQVGRFGVSDDGRYAVFTTASNNLAADDGGAQRDVYLSDRQTGALTRISRRPDGSAPDGDSFDAAISGDGRWIAYLSLASDVLPGGSGRGIYLFDRDSGTTQRLTPPVLPSTNASPAEISGLVVSTHGERVVFTTDSPLVAADDDVLHDLYGWSRDGGALQLLSVDANGQPLTGVVDAGSAALSAGGAQVSFTMRTVSGIADEGGVFVRDLQQGSVDRVLGPTSVLSQSHTSLSGDARYVALSTYAALLPADVNAGSDVYVFDRQLRQVELISQPVGGVSGSDDSQHAVISADGRYVVFGSSASPFGASVSGAQIYRRDRVAGTTTQITQTASGPSSTRYYAAPALSGDGRYVLFDSNDESLVAADDNRRNDVFAVDLAGQTSRVSQSAEAPRIAGASLRGSAAQDVAAAFVLGGDAAVVFASSADNLGPLRRGGAFRTTVGSGTLAEIALDGLTTVSTWPVKQTLAGVSADGSELLVRREPFDFTGGWGGPLPSEPWDLWRVGAGGSLRIDPPAAVGAGARSLQATLSDDGRLAQFVSFIPASGEARLFLHDAQTGLLTRIDVNAQGVPADRTIHPRAGLSRSGRYSAFVSAANNLVAGDADNSPDLFLRDNQTGQLTRLRDPAGGAPLVGAVSNREAIVISDDANRIAFVDSSGEFGQFTHLRLLDRTAARVIEICGSTTTAAHCGELALSADGDTLAFSTSQSLSAEDVDQDYDVYSYRAALDWLQLESRDGAGAAGSGQRTRPQLSASGQALTFRAVGGNWRTTPQITGDVDWLFKRLEGDAIFDDGFDTVVR
ncbi:MAG: hypothetical protein BGP24_01980 [Lysobacterales bacterium 69-70]|nr:hypothetical protein [Xanthomonadaceae bacterium]ODU31818.1 MAG: hypothetical protein ABS97_16250 [Xanthomonadaceae bacterium SCN 69-320]ODV18835.1 MAG: hypothetical protein ABT27_12560 [Xanthomonadaceae bacterium SCN 69-25]OJZ01542.1 MAG: hypothetical protein BGP24_01980 [Xanthomonadales bacterium 69-70]